MDKINGVPAEPIYVNDLKAHLPECVTELLGRASIDSLAAKPQFVEGAYAFLDISGFTALSETLSKYGREGTEILTHQISSYFQKALESIFLWGGDVVKFGGDALTVFFGKKEGEDELNPLLRACRSSLSITRDLSDFKAETPFGTFNLSLKIGISSGKVLFMVIGDPSTRLEYIFAGGPIDKTAEAEHNAKPSQVVLDPYSSELLADKADLEVFENKFSIIKALHTDPVHFNKTVKGETGESLLKPFLLPAVFEHIKMGSERMLSEHRPVVPCFVSFPSLDFGSADNAKLLQNYLQKVSELLIGLGGSFNRMDMGDKGSKFLCFFGAPETYADNEERAVAFALELKELEKKERWLKGQSIGISSGVCYAGVVGSELRREYTVMGDTVNTSARLMTAAKGSILVTKDVRERTKNKFKYSPYVKLTLKGKSLEVPVSSPLGVSIKKDIDDQKSGRIFVGRKKDSETLTRLIEHSCKAIYFHGPPGIGKSALAKKAAGKLPPGKWTTIFLSAPISRPAPFYLAGEVLKDLLSGVNCPSASVRNLERFFPDNTDLLPLFSILSGEKPAASQAVESLSQEQRIEALSELFAKLMELGSSRKVYFIDDFDRASKEESDFLTKVFERSSFKKTKFVLIGRNDRSPVLKAKAVPLSGLSRNEVEALVLITLKAKAAPNDLISFLYERSTGNPLYLVEILSGLKEMKIATINAEGFVVWKAEMSSAVSKSVEEILLMRIDNLDYTHKNLLKVASCFGETFEVKTLSKVFVPKMDPTEIEKTLAGLGHLGIDKQSGSEYVFSNKLLGSVAYDSILVSNKRSIHLQIADIVEIERRGDSAWETLAYHFAAGENFEKAYEYALMSARKAFTASAFHEAQRLYGDSSRFGLKLGKTMDEKDLLDYSKSLISTGEYDRAGGILKDLRNSRDESTGVSSRYLQLNILDQKGEYIKSSEESAILFEIAEKSGNGPIAISAIRYEVSSHIRLGRYDGALACLERGYKTALEFGIEDELPHLYILSGSIFYFKGEFVKAKGYYSTALEYSSKLFSYELMLRSYFGLSNCFLAVGDAEKALKMAKKAYDISKKIGSRLNMLGAASTIAFANIHLNMPEEALKVLRDSISLVDEKRAPYSAVTFFNQLGVTYYSLGNLALALKNFRKTLSTAKNVGNTQFIVNATYNIADILKELGDKKRAKNGFIKIIGNYSSSIDSSFLKKIASDLLNLVEEDLERKKIFRLLGKVAVSLQCPLLFDDLNNM